MFIGTEELTHTYSPGTPFAFEALRSISFDLEKGEAALLIGPSGSGKTTLIQHFNGLLKPTAGRVFFDGKPLETGGKSLTQLRKRIGLVFQMPEEHFFSESVFAEVAFAPRNLGLTEIEVQGRVYGALTRVGLDAEQLLKRHPFHLSAGQKRLVAIAAVLSLEPELLILDEPLAGLDSAGQNTLIVLLQKLKQEEHLTLIISTHHLEEIAAFTDKVLVLNRGKLLFCGKTEQILCNKRQELINIGLALPEVTEIMCQLQAEGLPVNACCYSLAAARQEINKLKEFIR
jgi:energy-coupling factor transport system ATP-binding protein